MPTRLEGAGGPQAFRVDAWLWWGALFVGVFARALLLAGKPLWRDEAWVALLVDEPMRAAADGRATPLGFVALTHVLTTLPGLTVEVSYRLLPLLAGIALLPLLGRLATTLGATRRVAVTAMWLAAGLQPLLYYSRELKSYGLDSLAAVLLPLLGAMAFGGRASGSAKAARIAFCVAAAAVPWLTFGGIFATGAVFAWGWLAWWWSADRRSRLSWFAVSAAFLASFFVVFRLALDHQANDPWMHAYWTAELGRDDRFSLPMRFATGLVDYGRFSLQYFFPKAWPAVLAASVLGACTWPRPGRAYLAFLYVVTAAVCVVAAMTDHYVLNAGRLLLFSVPLLLLWTANALVTVGGGAGRAVAGARGSRIGAALAVAAAIVFALASSTESVQRRVGPARTDGTNFFRFDVRQDLETILDEGRELRAGVPTVLVSRRITYMFQFYNRGRWPDVPTCRREDEACDVHAGQWAVRLKGRGWVLMADEEVRAFSRLFDKVGAVHRPLASTGGVRLWEVEKVPRSAAWPGTLPEGNGAKGQGD